MATRMRDGSADDGRTGETSSPAPGTPGSKTNWSLAHTCVVVFALSFLLLAMSPGGHIQEFSVPYGGEEVRVARSLAMSGTFANPFAVLRTGATAHVAPVYPFLYSLFLRAFGTGYTALLLLWAWNVGLLALQMALLPFLSKQLHLGLIPGLIAAALGSVSLHVVIDTEWECFLAGALLLFAFLLTAEAEFWQRPSGAALLGVLWGILLLTNPVTILLMGAWPAASVLLDPRLRHPRMLRGFAVMVCAALAIVSPWIARNYRQFGTFIFVRDNLGLELYTSNNSCAQVRMYDQIESACHAKTHPNATAAIAAQLTAAGEVSFNRAKLRTALSWIEANRSAFLILSARRARQFWFPSLDNRWQQVSVWCITLLGFLGLFSLGRKNRLAAWLIGSTWALFPLIYYAVVADSRYGYPIYWTLLLPAGCVLAEITNWARQRWTVALRGSS